MNTQRVSETTSFIIYPVQKYKRHHPYNYIALMPQPQTCLLGRFKSWEIRRESDEGWDVRMADLHQIRPAHGPIRFRYFEDRWEKRGNCPRGAYKVYMHASLKKTSTYNQIRLGILCMHGVQFPFSIETHAGSAFWALLRICILNFCSEQWEREEGGDRSDSNPMSL